ncbi:MAG: hypothetical protein CVT89_05730 [Candidatus Altiarchaeales archaeon HGW-Altiarchaeales-2]|nr:MAG: hypothetical protein CVT89_05730 [Candidatus Altiarchaeales archaeon HGW-Altiarchaeales-2]
MIDTYSLNFLLPIVILIFVLFGILFIYPKIPIKQSYKLKLQVIAQIISILTLLIVGIYNYLRDDNWVFPIMVGLMYGIIFIATKMGKRSIK